MNEALTVALVNLIAKVGLDSAIYIMEGMQNAKTLDDAITALKTAQAKTWADFKK